jgi:nitroimidazol reductase NimA-like FMN-containing flavoprotein (pyridoxamine 5'-phosphate oxidase superfamily)
LSIRLSKEEAWEELAAAHTGILTSLRADGSPITLPMWFVTLDERIYFSAPPRTKKIARLRRNPRCCFLVESGIYWRDLKAVLLTGSAHEVTDEDTKRRVREALDSKYDQYRTKHSNMPEETRSVYEQTARITFEMVPDDRILTWDNAKANLS